ncbi:hypothetical protein E2C01_071546 [Portunus trituberculatus]|uniref:Uncharacterized protein n=1 Tax=Portunus trituberculatus TaxID=210409 RepID=A0A5B7HXA2_PORTR|nr:hypothetical protein [Portunus trituberculatus]
MKAAIVRVSAACPAWRLAAATPFFGCEVLNAGYGVEVVMVGAVSGGGSSEGRRPRGAAPHSSSSSSRAPKSRGTPFPRPLGLATLVLVLAAFARAEQGKHRQCSPRGHLFNCFG